jgi:DNA polymerase elongation subunit (family B)
MNMTLEYQLYDFVEDHDIKYNDEGEEILGDYIIHSFGRTLDDKSVYAKITGYQPKFYIELPEDWEKLDEKEIKRKLRLLKEWLISRENRKVYYQYKNTLNSIKYVRKKKAEGFNNDKLFNFACLIFNNSDGMKKFTYFFEKNDIQIYNVTNKPFRFKLYESNVMPMLRCFHSRKISGCSWISVNDYKIVDDEDKESTCDIEINIEWNNLNPIIKDINAPLRIASFDIECYSHDGQFPQASRLKDEIIQIGITYTKLGSSNPYRKWIACLDKTDPIDGVDVVSCESERDVIDAFINEINKYDCDIITGYNIFYFDEKYIYDRCDIHLKMKSDIGCISKLKNKICNFKETKLASSALGENLLRIWDTPGRVHIDLMKDIQKTFNLPSYKLDFVASNFIRGEVKSFKKLDNDKYELTCVTVDDIQLNDYIHLEVIKGFISDDVGDKYFVDFIDKSNNILIVNSKASLDTELEIAKHGGKIFWSQAKDDVGPKDIFRMQKEGSKERAIIAKYCIKDCSLVNLLVNKLEVVTKNLEMSNVCYVPLTYLFTRGQGIKLFSLCSKEYKEQDFLFPVIKAKKDIDGNIEKEESYEGAIVFDPVAKIDYEALCTKDYMSLYPSAIMHKNMSHETIVEDPLYDNLEGITYYNAVYKENDGSNKYVRYAKQGNKLGVIPSILDNLLKERKNVKKLMKTEKNPFKYKILDAKQLAVKVTANSLYGQLGATTSPIAKRDIAACTTSTGREMLLFAKKYDEEILPWILNGLKDAYKNNDINRVNKILDWELKARDDEKLINKLEKYTKETIKDLTFQPVVRYGDSVASYTPIYIKVNNKIDIITIEELAIKYGNNNWLLCIEEGKEDKEFCELQDVETWSDKEWTKLHRVIRHKLDKNKEMYRILTYTGLVDVTDDHSLLLLDGNEISPKNINVNTELLHHQLNDLYDENLQEIYSVHVSSMLEAAKYTNYFNHNNISYRIFTCEDSKIILSINLPINTPNKVYKITKINYEGYVYDLTTQNHHFAAGVGNLIVHNTDSAFTCFRFKENTELVSEEESLEIFQKIIKFGEELIKPFLIDIHKDLFSNLYNNYFGGINKLELPTPHECVPEPSNHKIKLPIEDRMNQFIKEYVYYNYFAWLWTLQEIVKCDYNNYEVKLFDWANYILQKFKIDYNDLKDNRKEQVINPLIDKLESYYNNKWFMPSEDFINQYIELIKNTFDTEQENLLKINLKKVTKDFLTVTLKENWIYAEELHDVAATKDKKKLKRERKYNDKNLVDLVTKFIENNLKLNFDSYKNNHINKIINFVNDTLNNYWIQPWWDVDENNNKLYKIKIYKDGQIIQDKRTLDYSIELGELSGELVKSRLPFPHDLEYEKTFWPFMILTKKRYVGNKYEFDPNKYKQDFMGIVLKRRDNAPIVKEICSGIIDYLINKRDPEGAKIFTENCLENMFSGKYDIKYFLQSRTLKLKESYADWTKIAHVYLAEQIALRDPGNKPQSGDRIEFAVIKVPEEPNRKLLQGEMIEIPSYIKQNNIPINYMFYMKNQIMNPALQFLKLVDKNAEEIFIKFEKKYGTLKPKKQSLKSVKISIEPSSFKKSKTNKLKDKSVDIDIVLNKAIKETDDIINNEKLSKKKSKEKAKLINITNIEEIIVNHSENIDNNDTEIIVNKSEIIINKPKKEKKSKVIELTEEPTEEIIEKPKKEKKSKVIELAEEPTEEIIEKPKKEKKSKVIEVVAEEPTEEIIEKPKKEKKLKVIEVTEEINEEIIKPKKEKKLKAIEVTEEIIKPKKEKKSKVIEEVAEDSNEEIIKPKKEKKSKVIEVTEEPTEEIIEKPKKEKKSKVIKVAEEPTEEIIEKPKKEKKSKVIEVAEEPTEEIIKPKKEKKSKVIEEVAEDSNEEIIKPKKEKKSKVIEEVAEDSNEEIIKPKKEKKSKVIEVAEEPTEEIIEKPKKEKKSKVIVVEEITEEIIEKPKKEKKSKVIEEVTEEPNEEIIIKQKKSKVIEETKDKKNKNFSIII